MLAAVRVACQLLLAAIFVLSALGKFVAPRPFLGSVTDYQLLPAWGNVAVAVTLPGAEMMAGLFLLLGTLLELLPGRRKQLHTWISGAALLAAGMLVMFIFTLSFNLLRGISMDCGCMDFIGEHIPFFKASKATWATVWRDVVMLALCMPVLARKP